MDLWVKAKINPFPKNIISISDNVNIVDVVFIVVFYVGIEKKLNFATTKIHLKEMDWMLLLIDFWWALW